MAWIVTKGAPISSWCCVVSLHRFSFEPESWPVLDFSSRSFPCDERWPALDLVLCGFASSSFLRPESWEVLELATNFLGMKKRSWWTQSSRSAASMGRSVLLFGCSVCRVGNNCWEVAVGFPKITVCVLHFVDPSPYQPFALSTVAFLISALPIVCLSCRGC